MTATDYTGDQYYEEHRKAGLDYLDHGFWQKSYASMVTDATLQHTCQDPCFLDAGCACGSTLKGFKNTGLFHRVSGIDLSEHMVNLGRHHFGFTEAEMHIPDRMTETILSEFSRVLRPGGRAFLCLDGLLHVETKQEYMFDPTHCNIQPVAYWTGQLQQHGLLFDIEAYNRFARSELGPTEGDPHSFFQNYPDWSAWTLIKAL